MRLARRHQARSECSPLDSDVSAAKPQANPPETLFSCFRRLCSRSAPQPHRRRNCSVDQLFPLGDARPASPAPQQRNPTEVLRHETFLLKSPTAQPSQLWVAEAKASSGRTRLEAFSQPWRSLKPYSAIPRYRTTGAHVGVQDGADRRHSCYHT